MLKPSAHTNCTKIWLLTVVVWLSGRKHKANERRHMRFGRPIKGPGRRLAICGSPRQRWSRTCFSLRSDVCNNNTKLCATLCPTSRFQPGLDILLTLLEFYAIDRGIHPIILRCAARFDDLNEPRVLQAPSGYCYYNLTLGRRL